MANDRLLSEQLLKLLQLIHCEAKAAYWEHHTRCGRDFDEHDCGHCNNYQQCKRCHEITQLFKEVTP